MVPDTRGDVPTKREIAKCSWKALKTRHFTTALYLRDSRLPIANRARSFIASVKNDVL